MLTIEELRKLALLARIEVPDEELESLRGQMEKILEYVKQVQACPAESRTGRDEAGEAGDLPQLRNVFREDSEPHESGKYTEAIMANVPSSHNGFVKVKKIIEK